MNVAERFWQLTGSRRLGDTAARIKTAARHTLATLMLWQERGRQRRTLRKLEPALLRDIGRSRQEAMHEAAKPMWRA